MNITRKELFISALVLFAVILINFSGIFHGNFPMNDEDGNWGFVFKFYSAKMIIAGEFPLWNNLFFTGIPFFDQEITSNPANFNGILTAGLMKALGDPYLSYSLLIMLEIFLMGWSTYFMARKVFKLSSLAAYFPAVIYMLNMGQMERVAWMPGGFMVSPLLILFADRISEGRIAYNSVISGVLIALGFFFGSSMATGWSIAVFCVFVAGFIIIKEGMKADSLKNILFAVAVALTTFFALAAVVLIPFSGSMSYQYNLADRFQDINRSRIIDFSWAKFSVLDALFSNVFGFHSEVSMPTHNFSLLTKDMAKSTLVMPFFTGFWNYWSLLFYPLLLFFVFNRKMFSRKEMLLPLLIILYFLHNIILSFNHFSYIELLFTKGHNLFSKMQFSMQLVGGLFVGSVLDKLIQSKAAPEIRKINIVRLSVYPFIFVYFCLFAVFAVFLALYSNLGPRLAEICAGAVTGIAGKLSVFESLRKNYGGSIAAVISNILRQLLRHFFDSASTLPYMIILLSRLTYLCAFLALISAFVKGIKARGLIFLSVIILMLTVFERISILELYCAFNKDAPKNFSQDFREVRYLKKNLNGFERVALISHDPARINSFIGEKLGQGVTAAGPIRAWLDREKYYQIWQDFPESRRNGTPLYSVLNLPLEINTLNSLFAAVPADIWDVYKTINLQSEYFNKLIEDGKRLAVETNFDIYSAESPLIDLIGVKYVLSSLPLESKKLKFIFKGSRYYLYENKKVFPRVWVSDKVIIEQDRGKALQLLASKGRDFEKAIVSDRDLLSGNSDNARLDFQATIFQYRPDYVAINADVNKKSILVLSDTYFDGWEATVNGRKTDIERVDFFLRGVRLDKGNNQVVFKYRPGLFFGSLVFSLSALISITIFILYQRKKWQRS